MKCQCPFCKSVNVIPVSNSLGKHWLFCTDCRASGPHCDSPLEALTMYNGVTAPRKPGVIARLMGKG